MSLEDLREDPPKDLKATNLAITTRILRKKLLNINPVWGNENQIRVIKGTSIPNSNIQGKILRSEQKNKQTVKEIERRYFNIESSDDEDNVLKRYSQGTSIKLNGKTLEELKVLNNMLKKTMVIKEAPEKPKKSTKYERMVQAIRELKKKSEPNENVIYEEPELEELESISASSQITIDKVQDEKKSILSSKKTLKKKTKTKTTKGKNDIVNSKEEIQSKTKVRKIKKKNKTNKISEKKEDELKMKNGILPLRSSQDFSTTQVMTYLAKPQIIKRPIT